MEASDKRLWLGWLRQGDEHAFEALVRPHMAFALDFARRMGCTRDQADDVLQNCLTRLAGEQDSRPVLVGIRAWIGRSVSLEARMLKRAEGRRIRREKAWEPFVSDEESIDARMADVERGIDRLTPAQREVVWLRYRHDFDYREIAQMLGVSENACRLRVHKAMGDLRGRLGPDAGSLIATLPLLAGTGRSGLIAAALATAAHTAPAVVGSSVSLFVGAALLVGVGLVTFLAVGSGESPVGGPDAELNESAEAPGDEAPAMRAKRSAEAPGLKRSTHGGGAAAVTRPGRNAAGQRVATRPAAKAPVAPEQEVAAAARDPLLPTVLAQPRDYRRLIQAARRYFILEENIWRGRKYFLKELSREAKAGRYWLKDMQALRWLASQARSFLPPLSDSSWMRNKANQGHEYRHRRVGGTVHEISSKKLNFAYSIPKKYPRAHDLHGSRSRHEPYPLLLTMQAKQRYGAPSYSGYRLLEQRYSEKAWRDLYREWLVLSPVAGPDGYLDADGMVRAPLFQAQFAEFWKHYHLDFERVILDGDDQAFAAASSQALYFAGIVFRQGEETKWYLDSDAKRADVQNFAHVPVYVVNDRYLAQQLREEGHPSVTDGPDGEKLYAWMKARKRVAPKKFKWAAQRRDQVLAHWVNLDALDWDAEERTLAVEVLDTVRDPNTVKIDAVGIDALTLFLNDEIVDLDRRVRVVINGKVEHDARVEVQDPQQKDQGRDLDVLFNQDPIRIRTSMYFGWLKTARIVNLRVR